MPTVAARLQARIKRILDSFTDASTPDMQNYISGISEGDDVAGIDDGQDYSARGQKRPDWLKREEGEWESVTVLKRG